VPPAPFWRRSDIAPSGRTLELLVGDDLRAVTPGAAITHDVEVVVTRQSTGESVELRVPFTVEGPEKLRLVMTKHTGRGVDPSTADPLSLLSSAEKKVLGWFVGGEKVTVTTIPTGGEPSRFHPSLERMDVYFGNSDKIVRAEVTVPRPSGALDNMDWGIVSEWPEQRRIAALHTGARSHLGRVYPNHSIGQRIALEVTLPSGEAVEICPAFTVRVGDGTFRLVDARFASDLPSAHAPTPNEQLVFDLVAKGEPLTAVPIGGAVKEAGMTLGEPIRLDPSLDRLVATRRGTTLTSDRQP
jgi:hypothetical protein